MIGFPVFLSVTNFSLSGFFTDALTSVVKKRATDLTAPTFFTSTLTEVKVAGDAASSKTPVLLSKPLYHLCLDPLLYQIHLKGL